MLKRQRREQEQGGYSPGVNEWWETRRFHNYADYALSQEFRGGLEELMALGRERPQNCDLL